MHLKIPQDDLCMIYVGFASKKINCDYPVKRENTFQMLKMSSLMTIWIWPFLSRIE